MRRFDRNKNRRKVNLLAEQRHLESKGLVKENIEEEFYKSRKPLEGYVDAEELIGKHLWFHTNRTHRNQGKNGMVGIYTVTSNGTFKDLTRMYTNEVRIQGPIYFQTSYKTAEKIQKSRDDAGGAGRRTLHAGVSGIVVPTDSGNTGGMEVAQYNPFDKIAPWFYLTSDSEKKEIISADEVYFYATESGEWFFYVTNPVFSGQKRLDLEDQEQSAEEPVEKELEANPEINEVEQKRNTMRKFDKNKNIKKANLLAEQRHLESKGLIKEDNTVNENVFHAEGGVNVFTESEEVEEIEIPAKLQDEILNFFSQQRVGSAAMANDNKVAFYNWLEMMWSPENLHMGANSREIRTNNPTTMAKYLDRRGISGKTFVKEENNLNEVGRDTSPILGKARVQFIEDLKDLGFDIDKIEFIKSDKGQMFFKAIDTDEGLAQNRLDNSKNTTISSGKVINDGKGNIHLVFKIEK